MGDQTRLPFKLGPTFEGPDVPREEDLYRCVHCGLCLSACPTYVELSVETESPRGRIALMKAVNEGRLGISQRMVSHWDLCLQCRACEAVCPSGVPYGRLMESTRAQVLKHRKESWRLRLVKALLLRGALPHPGRLRAFATLLWLYQRWGFQSVLRKSHLLNLLPGKVTEMEAGLPALSRPFFAPTPSVYPARGTERVVVGLLSGCVMPLVQGPTMEATVRVLTANSCTVAVPVGQGCCGALNLHSGDLDMARRMARRNIDVFLNADVEVVVVASAGCGSAMKEYGELLKDDAQYRDKAERLGHMTRDVTEYLVELPFRPPQGVVSGARYLPGPVSSGPRSEDYRGSQGHPEFHTWAGAGGDGRRQPVLRCRGHLLHHPGGALAETPGEQGGRRPGHGSGYGGYGQPRMHDTAGNGTPAGRHHGSGAPRGGRPG